MPECSKTGKIHQGFTLLEILISIALLSLLSLVFITIFLQTKQKIQNGFYKAQAATIATNLIESIRLVRKDTEATTLYSPLYNQQTQWPLDTELNLTCHNATLPCNTGQIVADDINQIHYRVRQSLPNGNLQLNFCDANHDRSLCLTIFWLEEQNACQTEATHCLFIKFIP